MRVSTRVAGIAGAVALSMVTLGSAAFADSFDNDGTNENNDNNTITAPVQTCATTTSGSTLIPILSPQKNNCVNSPLVDHPSTEG